MTRLCYSCMPTAIVDDAKAKACPRQHCTARTDVERESKPQGTRPPQHNEPKPNLYGNAPQPIYYDDGGGV